MPAARLSGRARKREQEQRFAIAARLLLATSTLALVAGVNSRRRDAAVGKSE